MDFIVLFASYLVHCGLFVLFYLYSDSPLLTTGVLGKVRRSIVQGFLFLIPDIVINQCMDSINYVFNTRNHVMQCAFAVLVLFGHGLLVSDVLPVLYVHVPDCNHVLVPLVLLFTNLALYHLCCVTNAGHILPRNVDDAATSYKADGILYKDGVNCPTCNLVKPARSKHCSICDRCVERFDHHCIWTNNCVGARNSRYFVGFLVTLLAMCVNGAYMGARALVLIVDRFRLLNTFYVDPRTGVERPITIPVLIQHLFMQYPRCVFLVSALSILIVLLGGFTVYHLYLVVTNQTTNERNKLSQMVMHPNHYRIDPETVKDLRKFRPYDEGLLENLKQVVFPRQTKWKGR